MIAELESRILALIDNMVESASDDELFAGGYLRGHLTLAVADLESGEDHSHEAVYAKVTHSVGNRHSGGRTFATRSGAGAWHVGKPLSAGESALSLSDPVAALPDGGSASSGNLLFYCFTLQ